MLNENLLTDKVAIITGSTQGLGEATARLFIDRGARGVIITGRNAERGEALAQELSTSDCAVYFVKAALEDLDAVRTIAATADEKFGTVHILVNSAALTDRGTIWDTSPALFDRIMDVNVRAPFFLMQDTIRIMQRENVAGSIVNIGSVNAHGGHPVLAAYSGSKAALVTLTKNVAYSVMRNRIRVNAINLGWMDTPGEDVVQRQYHSDGQAWLDEAEAGMPFGRLIKTDEAARSIAYLASDESGMMTGAVLDLDQSVVGCGLPSVPPPVDQWPKVKGISYPSQDA